jgi:hypothetical protein
MSRYRSGAAFAATLLALLLPDSGEAQTISSPYRYVEQRQEAGAFVGHLSPDRGRFGYGPGPGLLLGARYGLELTGPLALEGVVASFPTTRDVINPAREEGDRIVGEADMALVMLEARLRFTLTGRRTWYRLQPYVVAGGGFAFDVEGVQRDDVVNLEERDRFDFGTKFMGSLGTGVRWLFTDRLGLRAEGLLSLWKLDTPSGYEDPARGFEAVPESEWTNATGFTVSLTWRW